MKCNGHEIYHSRADADRALADLIAHAKRTGAGGKSYKRLNFFRCGTHFQHRPGKQATQELRQASATA